MFNWALIDVYMSRFLFAPSIGKTPDEIRRIFNIVNDFTQEEEDLVRKENEWCEEKS